MRLFFLIALFIPFAGCGKKERNITEPPVWESKSGRLDVRLDLVRALLDGEQYDKALSLIFKVRNDGHKDPRLDLLQGMAMARQGLFTEAESMLKSAKEKMKRVHEPAHELGVLYAESGKISEAIAAFREAVEYDDNRASDWNNLGFLLFSQQNYVEATEALRQAITLDPTKEKYRNNLAFALVGQNKNEEAMRVFKRVKPKADAHYNMGVAHELSGDANAAEEQYTLALNENPNHNQALEAQTRLKPKQEQPQ